jgi:hypothetical protein
VHNLHGMGEPSAANQRIRELADSLGYVPDSDVLLMTEWSPATLEAYRKRGDGPPYVRFGARYYYPRQQLADYLAERVNVRRKVDAKGLL